MSRAGELFVTVRVSLTDAAMCSVHQFIKWFLLSIVISYVIF